MQQLFPFRLETNHSFTFVVLKHFPDDEHGKRLLERINLIDTIILEQRKATKGAKKKRSKMVGTSLFFLRILSFQKSSRILKDPAKNLF